MPIIGVAGNIVPRAKKKKRHDNFREWKLYVLLLEHGRYYVGITSYKTIDTRYAQHINGEGAMWTKLYKPISVVETYTIGRTQENKARQEETRVTIDYIEKYGLEMVRGGKFCRTDIKMHQGEYKAHFKRLNRKQIKKEFQSQNYTNDMEVYKAIKLLESKGYTVTS